MVEYDGKGTERYVRLTRSGMTLGHSAVKFRGFVQPFRFMFTPSIRAGIA